MTTLPNMDDLGKLTHGWLFGCSKCNGYTNPKLTMTEAEAETKFDNLTSCVVIDLNDQHLTSVPSVKNMGKLGNFKIAYNRITRLASNAFAGATR
jgi:hypothetical protein